MKLVHCIQEIIQGKGGYILTTYYLAVDIGASSGRHILGWLKDGKIILEEVHRFSNGLSKKDSELCWDVPYLFEEIIKGLKRCKEIGKAPSYMGIDTWGVDFVLLDEKNQILGNTVGYRDDRTNGMEELVYKVIGEKELYARTGIQKQPFNTIYQLMAIKQQHPEYFKRAKDFLLIPDYFNFLLTGKKAVEYTNATTTQLVSPTTKQWDYELISSLGYPKEIFKEMRNAGEVLGPITEAIREEIGYDLTVMLPATHDTGSAVLSVPSNEEQTLYISSGTWSLMGIEQRKADCSEESRLANLTNEGGFDYRFRYLKNIMGLWMIQSVKKEYNDEYSFAKLCEMANECDDFPSRVDVNDVCFLAPNSMIDSIKKYCEVTNQKVPQTPGEISTVIYQSLADCYGKTVKELEELSQYQYDSIHIVGGGCNAQYLNELTAKATKKTVYAGPTEATAIGNILAQMIGTKVFDSVSMAREAVFNSFEIKKFEA